MGKYIETGTRLAKIKVAGHAVGIIARCGRWVGRDGGEVGFGGGEH